ncbi:unnamed protein product [Ciceribacter sp. T2.26MG-112.2]|uniref:hypothetical protein n=1 Tax=Ciceribacter sp. T2.26MG-112.2 TaxID=3137154 RepID=UPI000E13465B|nr:hypothetical protein [Ciceribacter naphthalenivorans]SSC74096.1 unnamed protein product [Ciceribacter naphthalenivorans]
MTYLEARWPSSDKRPDSSKIFPTSALCAATFVQICAPSPPAGKGVICFTVDDDHRTVLIIAITYGGADWSSRVAERN